jgi:hypothetical protein
MKLQILGMATAIGCFVFSMSGIALAETAAPSEALHVLNRLGFRTTVWRCRARHEDGGGQLYRSIAAPRDNPDAARAEPAVGEAL